MELQIADDIKDTFQVEFTPVLADARLDCITFPSGMTSALEDFKQELKGQADIVIVDRFPGAGCNSMWFLFMFPTSSLYIFESGNGVSCQERNDAMKSNVLEFMRLKAPGSKVTFLTSSVTSVVLPKIDILYLEVHAEIAGGSAYDDDGVNEYLNSVVECIDAKVQNLILRGLYVSDDGFRIKGFGPPIVQTGTRSDGENFILYLFRAI